MPKIMPDRSRKLSKLATMSALAIILAACGGGGSGGGGSGLGSTPPPPPPPPTKTCPDGSVIPVTDICPPPPSPTFVNIFPNVTTSTEFAVLGQQANAPNIPLSSLVSGGFSVRFDAMSDAYVIDLPASPAANFEATGQDNSFWFGRLVGSPGTIVSESSVNVFKPLPTNPQLALEHTTFATFYDMESGWYDYDGDGEYPHGAFAFGTATSASAIPTTGSAIFDAIIAGYALDDGRGISGSASLQFNFGAGTLAGSFNPRTIDAGGALVSLGTYSFANTVFGVGSTTFSGQLQRAGTSDLGAFNGLFTGPAAQELMAKWTAPYLNPDTSQWKEMFGVWVGKKQ